MHGFVSRYHVFIWIWFNLTFVRMKSLDHMISHIVTTLCFWVRLHQYYTRMARKVFSGRTIKHNYCLVRDIRASTEINVEWWFGANKVESELTYHVTKFEYIRIRHLHGWWILINPFLCLHSNWCGSDIQFHWIRVNNTPKWSGFYTISIESGVA